MMKRLVLFFMSMAFMGGLMAQPVIKFDSVSHDFGSFPKSKVQLCEFSFTNVGDKPLVVHQAYGTCGCTIPLAPKDPIKPGEKGVIKVKYDGKQFFKGFFRKMVTVRTNATNNIVRIYIQGTMLDDEEK